MKPIFTLTLKEFRDGFRSSLLFLFLTGVLLVSHQLFLSSFFLRNQTSLHFFFIWLPLLWIPFVPAITMERWAGERRHGTLDLLQALPLKTWQIALGKFLGSVLILGLTLFLTTPLAITVSQLGDLDWGIVACSYLGCFLVGAFGISLGLIFSQSTRVPIVAFFLTLFSLTALTTLANPIIAQNLPFRLQAWLALISLDENIKPFFVGLLSLKACLFFVGITLWWLVQQSLDAKRSKITSALILLGCLWGLKQIPNSAYLDLTRNQIHSVSPQTESIVKNLKDRLTFKLYFSKDVPFAVQDIQNQLEDLLLTLKHISPNDITIDRVNVESETGRERARQLGIEPLQLTVREQNTEKVQEIYLGFSVHYQDKMNVVGLATNPETFEYQIALSLLKLSSKQIPKLAVCLPAGSRRLEYSALLSILEQMADITLWETDATFPSEAKALLILDPKEAPTSLGKNIMDALYERIPVIVFLSESEVSDSVVQTQQQTGLESFLQERGLRVSPVLALDADQNAKAQFDLGTSQVLLDYPFWIKLYRPELHPTHPATAQLEELLLPWTNVLQFDNTLLPATQIEVLAKTSAEAFLQEPDLLSVSPQYIEQMNALPKVQSYPVAAEIRLDPNAAPLFVVANTQMVRNAFLNTSYFTEAVSNAGFAANLVEYTTWGDRLIGLRSRSKTVAPLVKLTATQKNQIYGAMMSVQVLLPSLVWFGAWAFRRRNIRKIAAAIGKDSSGSQQIDYFSV